MAKMKKAKKLGVKIKAGFKKTALKAKKVLKKAGNVAVFAPLIPFKSILQKILSKKGVNTKYMSLPELAKQFHNKIVAPKNNFQPIPEYINFESDNLIEESIPLVTAIIKYIKELRDEYKAGKKLDVDSESLVKATNKIEKKLSEKAIKEAQSQTTKIVGGDIKAPKNNNILMFVVIGIIAFFIFKK